MSALRNVDIWPLVKVIRHMKHFGMEHNVVEEVVVDMLSAVGWMPELTCKFENDRHQTEKQKTEMFCANDLQEAKR